MSHALIFLHTQNLTPHNDESKDSDDDSKFDAFVEEIESH